MEGQISEKPPLQATLDEKKAQLQANKVNRSPMYVTRSQVKMSTGSDRVTKLHRYVTKSYVKVSTGSNRLRGQNLTSYDLQCLSYYRVRFRMCFRTSGELIGSLSMLRHYLVTRI